MKRPVLELDMFRYKISDIQFHSDSFDESITIDKRLISTLTINKNYDGNIVPLMLLNINVNIEHYEKIITSMDTLMVSFTIYKSLVKENDKSLNIDYNTPYISGKFKAFNQDNINTAVVHQLKNSKSSDINDMQKYIPLTLYLYDHESVIKFNRNKSFILEGTMNDCIFNVLKDRDFKNILMSSINSSEMFDIIIPYGNMKDNLNFLEEYYGIYDTPRLFFSDFDRVYFLEKGSMGKCLEKDELAKVYMYMESNDNKSSVYNGSYEDKENGIYILNVPPVYINDTDTMQDFYSGGKITTIVSGTDDKSENSIGKYGVEKTVMVNNKKAHNRKTFEINENKRTITIEFSDIDLSIITPNKLYTLNTDTEFDKSYSVKGDYRLSQQSIIFSRQGEDELKNVTQCIFSKITK